MVAEMLIMLHVLLGVVRNYAFSTFSKMKFMGWKQPAPPDPFWLRKEVSGD